MLKIVLNDLFISFKKSWISILLYTIFMFYIANYTISLFIVLTNQEMTRESVYQVFASEQTQNIIISVTNIIYILTLFLITKKIPLRLSKAMFVCPASDKDKMKYMYLQLLLKVILGFVFIFLSTYLMVGVFFINKGLIQNIIELGLLLFLIITFNLKVGIGEEGLKKKDKKGYIIYTKEEEIINYYFFSILLIETILFYSLNAIKINSNIFIIIGWIIIFIINSYVIYKCTSPLIKKSLSFEDVYRQVPDKEEGY
ncbi:hypothetical protein E5347_04210 [Clostridium sartagoforme]|uniref:Uncharacterized protein n=1 Tax=Clostridium sartagoforme TaxID=84031 RepID=A0A4S2DNU0_9CLOT|nr:hypothetical protein [Clostridium sartagoforme]TGY44029.1 hypothetical protein E5347_04210 [Clostridium sartagoforme]